MNILILSSKFPYPLKDGGAIATFQTFRGLQQLADNVHILSFNTSKHFVNQEDINSEFFDANSYTLVYHNTNVSILKALKNLFFSQKPYILERFTSRRYTEILIAKLQETNFDIVQIEGLYMLQYIDVIRKYSKAKIAYRSHNIEHEIWQHLSAQSSNILRKIYFKILSNRILRYEKFCIDRYDMLVPISENDADYYRKLSCKKPILVVPTGFDFENLPPQNENCLIDRHKLFYIGSLEWLPNQEGLLWFLDNCWHKLRQKQPNIELYVAGRNAPKCLIDRLLQEKVQFVGEVASSIDFMRDKAIMIVPLLSGSGMRIKIIEAFVNKKAVVSSKTAIKGIKIFNNQNIIIAENHDKFVNNILKLINNEELYNKVIKDDFIFAQQNFDNRKIIKRLYQFYKETHLNFFLTFVMFFCF